MFSEFRLLKSTTASPNKINLYSLIEHFRRPFYFTPRCILSWFQNGCSFERQPSLNKDKNSYLIRRRTYITEKNKRQNAYCRGFILNAHFQFSANASLEIELLTMAKKGCIFIFYTNDGYVHLGPTTAGFDLQNSNKKCKVNMADV